MHPPEQAPDAAGHVVVDIGGDMGAAVIYTPHELAGEEIEIRAAGTAWDGTHTGVWERRGPGISATAAVFGSLRAGRYELRIKGSAGTEHPDPVVIEGAQVTQVTWAGAMPVRSALRGSPAIRVVGSEPVQRDGGRPGLAGGAEPLAGERLVVLAELPGRELAERVVADGVRPLGVAELVQ
jgi:hypothetical protein